MESQKHEITSGAYKPDEAFRRLGISRSLGYEALRRGTFPTPVIRCGRRLLILKEPLERLLRGEQPNTGGNRA